MKEFKVNEYITLKLEDNNTNLYVNGEIFNQCDVLLLEPSMKKIKGLDDIESIDEIVDYFDAISEPYKGIYVFDYKKKIPPEVEFWGHCSNIQAWAEHKYNTKILHREYAFPLLKKLTEVGDPIARKVFRGEIIKRFEQGHIQTCLYLFKEKYCDNINEKEKFFLKNNIHLLDSIIQSLSNAKNKDKKETLEVLKYLIDLEDFHAKKISKDLWEMLKKRESIMDIDIFWNFIEKTRKERKNNNDTLEETIYRLLDAYSITDIYIFEEIYRDFTAKLRYDEKFAQIIGNKLGFIFADDSWYYLCQGFVLLGKGMYLLALFNRDRFVEIIGKGRFGSQTHIMKELYITDHVLERLIGPLEPIDEWSGYRDLKSIDKIRSEVDSWINKNSGLIVEKKTKKATNFKTMDKWFKKEK